MKNLENFLHGFIQAVEVSVKESTADTSYFKLQEFGQSGYYINHKKRQIEFMRTDVLETCEDRSSYVTDDVCVYRVPITDNYHKLFFEISNAITDAY